MLERVARWAGSPGGVVAASVLTTVVLACLANVTLDLWHVGGEAALLVEAPLSEEFGRFLLGSLVVWLFVVLLLSVLGRLWVSVGVVTIATVVLGYANARKQQQLLEPLYPSDFVLLADPDLLVQSVGPPVLLTLLAGSAAVIVLAVLTARRCRRWFPHPGLRDRPRVGWAVVGGRVVAAVASVMAISSLTHFHAPGNPFKAAYEEIGAHWRPWHQSLNYTDNGFVAGMLYNMPMPAMRRPAGYGPATMRELVARYSAVASHINAGRDPEALHDVNVVFLLGETFSDPTRTRAVQFARDPIPFTRALMRRTTSGNMWSPMYGGGTANVEFEALTGQSLAQFSPQMTTPYQMLVPTYAHFPAGTKVLEQYGHKTLALHSYSSALYRRAEVYPALGFDDAVFQNEMTHTERLADSRFVSDRATYAEVLARLDRAKAPMFLNVVTMQNHYPMAGTYKHPIPVRGLHDAQATESLEHYARGLRHSDNAMRGFVRRLEASEEKTVVVFYGDHLPPVWPRSALSVRARHETPFFVLANFELSRSERLPTTSPIYFMNHVLRSTDAPVPAYYALLQRLEQQIPAMGQTMMIGPDDRRKAQDQLPARARRLLRDYRLVQYDLSVGDRYAEAGMFDAAPTHPPPP